MEDAPVIYGLEFQGRALTAQVVETDRVCFMVGTQSLKSDNQIHFVDFDEENNVINKTVFLHRVGEIWHISSSTLDKNLLTTCYNHTSDNKSEIRASVWRFPSSDDSTSTDDAGTLQSLEHLCNLDTTPEPSDMKCISWHPTGESTNILGITDSHILLWDLNVAGASVQLSNSTSLEGKGQPKLNCGQWNPHHNSTQIATANDTTIRGWDLRTMQQVYCIEAAHGQLVRDLDFNPNKQYCLASCGDDCKVKFWDTRKTEQPLKVLADHSHWVWSVRYNHFHDQLVLTSSSDSRVVLNNVASLSSEPYGNLIDDETSDNEDKLDERGHGEVREDAIVCTYEEHEDSVYAVDWSSADPWLFVSLSYDGRLVINRVPRTEKYKILL